jgi:hypothetical protein
MENKIVFETPEFYSEPARAITRKNFIAWNMLKITSSWDVTQSNLVDRY